MYLLELFGVGVVRMRYCHYFYCLVDVSSLAFLSYVKKKKQKEKKKRRNK